MAAAPLVCPDQTFDPVSQKNLSGSTDPTVVKLSVGNGHVECYEFESVYGLLKGTIISGNQFRSPFTRNPYSAADKAEIERIRIIYVAADPARAAMFPSLENLVPGEASVNDAQDAIAQIAANVEGAEARLERILARGLINNSSTNEEQENLLFAAITHKLSALIERFKPGGNFTTKTRHYTPFLLACEMGDFSIIKMVAPNPTDKEAVNAKLGHEEAPAPIVVAAGQRNRENIPEMLGWLFDTYHYDIECTNGFGATPLIVAVDNGNIPVTRYLLEKGANVNALTKTYESTLKLAAYNGQIEMVDILLASGAKMYYNDKEQSSAVSNAERRMGSTKSNNVKGRYAAIIERLRPIPVVHISGVDRPAAFIQQPAGAIAAQQAAIVAGQRRAIAAIQAAEAAEAAEAAKAAAEAAKAEAATTAAPRPVVKTVAAKTVAAPVAPRQPAAKTVAAKTVASRAAAPVISIRERQRQQEEQAAARRAAAAARSGQTVSLKTAQVGFGSTRKVRHRRRKQGRNTQGRSRGTHGRSTRRGRRSTRRGRRRRS